MILCLDSLFFVAKVVDAVVFIVDFLMAETGEAMSLVSGGACINRTK